MALEDLTGPNKYLNALVPTNPLGADDRREGDDHIRGIKNVLLNTFGALSGPVNMETQYVDAAGDTMTGPLKMPDGSAAAPALTFASEAGLGWYRAGGSRMAIAAGGSLQGVLDFAGRSHTLTASELILNGLAPDNVSLILNKGSDPAKTSNVVGRRNGQSRWLMKLGSEASETGSNTGSDFKIERFADSGAFIEGAFSINRSDGNTAVTRGLSVGSYVSAGGALAGQGHYYLVNEVNSTVMDMGVGVLTGFGDSAGINVPNATGTLYFGLNGNGKIWIEQARNVLYNNRIDISTPDLRITGIATTGSAANLYQEPTNGYIYRSTSSLRYKRDVADLTDAQSEAIYALRPVSYHSKSEADDPNQVFYGLIAEEVAEHCPQVVSMIQLQEGGPLVPDGVQYERLIPLMLAELAKLRARVAQLEAMLQV